MELSRQVTIISAFGRGHWLAASLIREGLQVTLIDVTAKMGVWPSEDAEGPFGFFRNDRLSELQNERVFSEDPFEELPNGFTVWLKQGPIEFKSPLTGFYFEREKWPQGYFDVLSPAFQGSDGKGGSAYRSFESENFSRQWVLHFAHQWNATTYLPSARSAFQGNISSLLSSFCVRNATRMGFEKSLNWLREKNVEVLTQTELRDLSFASGKMITGLELLGEKQGHFKTDRLIWMLSSEESYFLNEKIAGYLFPQGALEPEWCWVRYRVKLAEGAERNSLPLHMVLIEDLDSPWTHENLMILQRTALPEQFDAWIRIPNVQRFNKEYLTVRGAALLSLLKRRMDSADPQIQTYPQEYYYTYSQLGANRFPVFAEKTEERRGKPLHRNLSLDSAEVWTQYTWDETFLSQEKIRVEIVQWWKATVQKHQKSHQGKELNP